MKVNAVVKGIALGVVAGAAVGGAVNAASSRTYQVKRAVTKTKRAAQDAMDTFRDDMGF